MASDPNQIIAGLLQGAGFGRTVSDNQQQQAQITGLGLQNQGQAFALQAAQQKAAREQAYQAEIGGALGSGSLVAGDQIPRGQQSPFDKMDEAHDFASYYRQPTLDRLAQLALKYPEHAEALKQSYAVMDSAQRQSTLNIMGSIASAASNGRHDLVIQQLKNVQAAEKAKGIVEPEIDDALVGLNSSDPVTRNSALKAAQGFAQIHLAAADPSKFADNLNAVAKGSEGFTLGQGQTRYDSNGQPIASVAPKPDYLVVPEGGKAIPLNGAPQLEGGGLASSGGAAGEQGDVSRLINTDAGGGYVPDSVKTLGQFVGFGKSLNQRGAKSSSAGTYQINGSTMAEFAPKALGPDWKQQPFNADTQDKVGEAIFNWAKQQPNPAQALKGRWVSLNDAQAQQLVQGDWTQARGTIAAGETGGGVGASAAGAPTRQGGDPSGTVYGAPKTKDAPSGYRWNGGNLEAIPGGPADKGAQGSIAPDDVIGQPYKKYLSPGRAALVQAVIDGRAPAPRPGSKYGEALAEDVARVDPTADSTTLPIRQKVRTEFNASGKQGQAMQAYNRFAAHLNSAWALHQQLGGANLGPLSGIAASIGQSFSPGLVSKYNTEIEGLQGEFQKLTKLGVANEGEANRLIANAKAAQSADGRGGALKGMAELVAGAYKPAVEGWHAAFPNKPLPIDIAPGTRDVINNVLHDGKNALKVDADWTPRATAVRVTTPQQASSLPSGTLFMTPDGRTLRKR